MIIPVTACIAGLAVFAQTPANESKQQKFDPVELQMRIMVEARQKMDADLKAVRDQTAAHLEKLGARVEREVVAVNLVSTKVTDEGLKALRVFPDLQRLYLHHTGITDAGIANLQSVRSLTTLDLFDTRVTDAGLAHLAEWMPHLEWLELSDTSITDAGIRSLKGLKHLRRLNIQRAKVSDAAVEELRSAVAGLEIVR
jgi:hypothetical protein